MITTTTTTLTLPTTIQGVVGIDCHGCSLLSLLYSVCSYYVTPERTPRHRHGRECAGGNYS